MKCCECKCSFAKCIEEHQKDLNKEFNQMIESWMKNHPEVKQVYITDNRCYLSDGMTVYQDTKMDSKVHFE
jgi:hypothetical protein